MPCFEAWDFALHRVFLGFDLRKLLEDCNSQAFVLREAIGELKFLKFRSASSCLGILICRAPICAKLLGDYNSEAFVLHYVIKVFPIRRISICATLLGNYKVPFLFSLSSWCSFLVSFFIY